MNIYAERGRSTEPLLMRFIAFCAFQITVAVLVTVCILWNAPWPRFVALLVAIGALGAGVLMFLSARRLWQTLNTLNHELDQLGQQRLPEIVGEIIKSKDVERVGSRLPTSTNEKLVALISDVEEVCTSAVLLATEHDQVRSGYAEVFVNLFRRTQTLLLRQMQIIEKLEEGNRSPADLNRFYQLDHLVMRMRRNNENILVLSGTELVRKTKDPVPIDDLLRASISEIDNYQRVRLLNTPSVRVSNTAAGDLIRIVAELLDNATAFSPPDKQVTVKAELGRHQGLSIGVIDNGVGMSDVDLVKANEQLGRLGSAEIARSRRLGLLVVGRLAGRHGFRVELFGGDNVEGVSALVSVPSSVLLEEDAVRASLPGDANRGSTVGARGATANRAGRGVSAVPMTLTVLRQERTSPDEDHVRRPSSWHNRSKTQTTSRATLQPSVEPKLSKLVAQAHEDVSGELPTRVPNRLAGEADSEPIPEKSDSRSGSRWFQARSSNRQRKSTSTALPHEYLERASYGPAENWQSKADEAWQKAEGVNHPDRYTYTEDGLPIRQQGAHLISGIADDVSAGAVRTVKPIERDAKHTMRRLSSYQQGVQKAKEQEARIRGTRHSGGWTVLDKE
jgi:signal transduction histidine kinase